MRLLNLWLHMVAAAVWIGASASLALLWFPPLRERIAPDAWNALLWTLGRRYIQWAWLAIHALVLSGIVNVLGIATETGLAFRPAFLGRLVGKLLLVLVMLLLQCALGFIWLPRLQRAPSGVTAQPLLAGAFAATSVLGGLVVWLAMGLWR